MKNLSSSLFLAIGLLGCTNPLWPALAFEPDKADADAGINHQQQGFFILRYSAYQGAHRLGGTLNEISIRNLSGAPLRVESLTLVQVFRGQQVTQGSWPIQYEGLSGGILLGNKPTTRRDIAPGQWMSFDFPTKDIQEFSEGDRMYLTLSVSLTAGAQHFEKKIEFTKILMKSQPAPL